MDIFKKVGKNLRYMDVEEFSDYFNCLFLSFISEHSVELYDYQTGKYVETIKF